MTDDLFSDRDLNRFESKRPFDDPLGCWEWTGTRDREGYGRFVLGGRKGRIWAAHRLAWTLRYGPIPDGLLVCHTCDNPPCVNPAHLFLGTTDDNMADMTAKGRHGHIQHPDRWPRGEQHHSARLDAVAVEDIRVRNAGGVSQRALAREYGVTQKAIYNVVKGKTWTK